MPLGRELNLRQLRYFVALAEELHFRKAAERLNLAQPALTRQIQELEGELQVTLLRRDRRHVELTSAGLVLLERAKRVLAEVEYAVVATRQSALRLSFSFVPSASYVLVPAVLKEFRRECPGVDLDLQSSVTVTQLEALTRRRIDVGIIRPWPRPSTIDYLKLISEPFVVALPKGHPHEGRSNVPLATFADERFIVLPGHLGSSVMSLYELTSKVFRRAGFAPQVAREVPTDMHTALGMVNAGFGVAMVPRSMMRFPVAGVGFATILESEPDSELGIAWRSDDDNPLCRVFVTAARQAAIIFGDAPGPDGG